MAKLYLKSKETEVKMENIELYLAAGEAEKPSREDGHRRCSFVVLVKSAGGCRVFWGIARLKDMTALFSFALNAGLASLFPEDLDAGPWPKVEVIAKSPDFGERIDQASRREAEKPKKMADQRRAWKDTATLRALFNIPPARAPETPDEERLLRKATAFQQKYAKRALLEVPSDFSGAWADGELELGEEN